ncbi:MAG TPA: DUF3052 domain-containing protein [Bacillaceae bacterium]
MQEIHPVLKKLQFKDRGQTVLVLQAPKSYDEVQTAFQGKVDHQIQEDSYEFIQVFGTTNEELQSAARKAAGHLAEDGLLWLCYPKKSSKTYKGSDCSRESVAPMLAEEGYEPVRQIAIDEDWSALRFRKTENIKKMTRGFAHTEKGKERTQEKTN